MSARDDRAEAMREACATHLRDLLSHEQDMVVHALEVRPISTESLRDAMYRAGVCEGYRLAEAAIRALPLAPAPIATPADDAVDPDAPIKCGTFGGVTIPPDVRARMDADRAAAEASAPKPHGFPPVYYFADDAQGNPCLFWRNPFSGEPESLARFMWPTHPKEWDVDGWWDELCRNVAAALNQRPADDAVARALRDIKAMSLGHHAHEDPAVLLHALLVEIPSAIDAALGGD